MLTTAGQKSAPQNKIQQNRIKLNQTEKRTRNTTSDKQIEDMLLYIYIAKHI